MGGAKHARDDFFFFFLYSSQHTHTHKKIIARLAQMVERMTHNHVVVGSIPTVGVCLQNI